MKGFRRQRIREHTMSSVNGNKLVSALSIHAIDNEHSFDFEGVRIRDYRIIEELDQEEDKGVTVYIKKY